MNRLLRLTLRATSVLLVATAAPAFACECRAGAPERQPATADAVFEATVESITGGDGPDWLVQVTVRRRWKGVDATKQRTLRSRAGKGCGYFFQEGQTYLVFAMKDKASGGLRVTTCGATQLISEAAARLKELGPPLRSP